MHIVLVSIQVKPDQIEDFIQATIENARNSINEPGIERFDFIQQVEKRNHFMLIEVYGSPEEQLKHRNTTHYKIWKEAVADMMAEPRLGVNYVELYPPEADW